MATDQFTEISADDVAFDEADYDQLDDDIDELSPKFVETLIDKVVAFQEILVGHPLHAYQMPFARRVIESVIIGDGETISALASRQSGKTETVADVVATLMVLLPRLAKIYPDLLGKFANGFWVGMFAPVEGQAETLFGRTVSRLTSERAQEILGDPEIDDITARHPGVTKGIALKKSGSFMLMMTANPRAKIESKTFHLAVLDESQEMDDHVVSKSISPMLAYTAGTLVKTGTPARVKNHFYKTIQLNKRMATGKGKRKNHYQWDWREVAKVNKNYAKFVKKEMLRIGEDSDEFQMSYLCVTPDTRILTADLRHIPAGDVRAGMKLVGFEEERASKGEHRKYQEADVLGVTRQTSRCLRVLLDDGTSVTVSRDHRWLVFTAGGRTVWKATEELATSDRIFRLTDTWSTESSYESGYLAAAFEGEGCLQRRPDGMMTGLCFTQRDNVMLEQVRKHLANLGFSSWESGRRDDVQNLYVAGGKANLLRFLGSIRPQRLLDKLDLNTLGSIGRHDHRGVDFTHPRVVGLEDAGEQEVVVIETDTGTYVAEGLASHNCRWMLDRGMFITQTAFDNLGDTSQEIVRSWHQSPVVVGIDPARKADSTVVTVVWVNWDTPDEFGFFDHRVLNWLEIQGDDWEAQYYQIVNFLAPYDVLAVAVDSNGVGDAVAQRLDLLLPRAEVIPVTSSQVEQSRRWKHLQSLIQREMIGWPAHSKTRRLKNYQRFMQQMTDAEKKFSGQHFTVEAPDEAGAHDDYVDSLALACSLTRDLTMPEVQQSSAPWFG